MRAGEVLDYESSYDCSEDIKHERAGMAPPRRLSPPGRVSCFGASSEESRKTIRQVHLAGRKGWPTLSTGNLVGQTQCQFIYGDQLLKDNTAVYEQSSRLFDRLIALAIR